MVLSERERAELERLVRAFTTGQQLALRARIVLLAGLLGTPLTSSLSLLAHQVNCLPRVWPLRLSTNSGSPPSKNTF